MNFNDHIKGPSSNVVLDDFDIVSYDYLLTEEDDYREFCEFVDRYEIISEGIIDKIIGPLRSKLEFIKNISKESNIDLTTLVNIFKDSRIFKFFNRIGWSFKKLYDLLKKGFKLGHDLSDTISEYLANTRVAKWTKDELEKLDEFLKKHPKTKRIIGIGVAAILAYIWFNMAFTGDFKYDFGMDDLLNALAGKMVLSDIFAGREGIKLLMLFTVGMVGASFPWPGPGTGKFIFAIIQTLIKKLKIKLKTGSLKLESTVSGILPDTGGVCSDDDNPPGNILIGTAMKWKLVPSIGGTNIKIYEPVDKFKYSNIFRNTKGQDKVDYYSTTLQKDPLKHMYGNRLFKYMNKKKATELRKEDPGFFDIYHGKGERKEKKDMEKTDKELEKKRKRSEI
jgi:hypothetical protein